MLLFRADMAWRFGLFGRTEKGGHMDFLTRGCVKKRGVQCSDWLNDLVCLYLVTFITQYLSEAPGSAAWCLLGYWCSSYCLGEWREMSQDLCWPHLPQISRPSMHGNGWRAYLRRADANPVEALATKRQDHEQTKRQDLADLAGAAKTYLDITWHNHTAIKKCCQLEVYWHSSSRWSCCICYWPGNGGLAKSVARESFTIWHRLNGCSATFFGTQYRLNTFECRVATHWKHKSVHLKPYPTLSKISEEQLKSNNSCNP